MHPIFETFKVYIDGVHVVKQKETVFRNFVLFMPSTINNEFMTLNQHNAQNCFLVTFNGKLNVRTCFDPQAIFTRESNKNNSA